MAFDFTGKKVLVTGAAKGIGRGIAISLVKAGCKVYALDILRENLETLNAEHPSISIIVQDLSNWEETRSALEKIEVLDGLVNNAAIFMGQVPALEQTKEELDKYMLVNLFGYINCIQVIGKKMVEARKKGSIVNISSVLSKLAWTGYFGYATAKAGIDMVTKQFALELGPHGIRVNAVNPTMVETDMKDSQPAEVVGTILGRTPMHQYNQIDDVVGPVMYLLSDYAAMVTGTTHPIDGGIGCNFSTK